MAGHVVGPRVDADGAEAVGGGGGEGGPAAELARALTDLAKREREKTSAAEAVEAEFTAQD